MELRHLEHFVAVAEEQSFTRAAARIHVVQSGLSVSIRSLERELGARLFDRTTHRVELTDAGAALLVEARLTLAAADAARDAVAAVSGGIRGTVRIGIMQSLTLIDLAALLADFNRERPQVQLIPRASQGGSAMLARDVLEGRLDMAFAALPSEYPAGLTVVPLASEDLMLACPPDHPLAKRRRIALRELDGERFVDFPVGWGTRISADRLFRDAGLQREIVVEVADIPNAMELVRAGFGFAFVAPSTIHGAPRVAISAVRPTGQFNVSLISASHRRPTAAARAFIEDVVAAYPNGGKSPDVER